MRKISYPLIIVNFKTYLQATGDQALSLSRTAEHVSLETGAAIGVAPQAINLMEIANAVDIPVFAQHIDPCEPGSHTGAMLPETVKASGAVGTLINHSEKRMLLADVETALQRASKARLATVVCANNAAVSQSAAVLSPTMVAVEVPELIGTGRAISKVQPEVVTRTVDLIRKTNSSVHILCGAGISSGEDISAALKLDTEGVLLASAVVCAKDPEKILFEMASAAVREK
ncbi:MAG: triose-phosphate isomerase [Nitrososphaeria archaeon]